jgi:AAA+ superfamily predicted ATPase
MNDRFLPDNEIKLQEKDIPEAYNTKDLPTIMKGINELVGLSKIKEQINDLVSLLKFNKKANIDIRNFNMHMVFSGNPGTGKTTVARMITDILFNLGYINQNRLTEVTAKDLIADYVGQTSGKTFNVVKSALGGVLFIDEAYAITQGYQAEQYGAECIATLLTLMENYKDKLIIIFAGYKDEMQQFMEVNPGLLSRIGYNIEFPDYTLEELTQIYLNLLSNNKLKIKDDALEKLKGIIKTSSNSKNFGNGRYINNIFQKILIEHSKNIENKKKNLYLITENDIKAEKLVVDDKNKKIGFGMEG